MYLIFLLIASWLISFAVVALIAQSGATMLLDIPNSRSSHTRPTPRGGGLGFIIAFGLTSWLAQSDLSFDWAWLMLVLLPLAIVGIVDDRQDLPAGFRYGVQFAVATVAIWHWGLPFPAVGWWGWLLGVVIIGFTALINFYNFMDGLDGLVAGCSVVQLTFLAVSGAQPIWGLMAAAVGGFLWWNWSPAAIFMGDVGSTVLGACVAVAILAQNNFTWWWVVVTLPLVSDAVYTLIRRQLRGENIFQAHRSHLYQRLQISGWTHGQVAASYILLNSAIAIWLYYFGKLGAGLTLAVLLLLIPVTEIYLQGRQT